MREMDRLSPKPQNSRKELEEISVIAMQTSPLVAATSSHMDLGYAKWLHRSSLHLYWLAHCRWILGPIAI